MSEEEILKVSHLTEGMSGAELENIVNLAALASVKKALKLKSKVAKLQGKDLVEFVT